MNLHYIDFIARSQEGDHVSKKGEDMVSIPVFPIVFWSKRVADVIKFALNNKTNTMCLYFKSTNGDLMLQLCADMSNTFIEKSRGKKYFLFWFFYWVYAQIEVISTVLMTRVSSFILFRKH